MIRGQKRFQGESAAFRIKGSGMQFAASFKNAADFLDRVRMRIKQIKDLPAGLVQVDLVSCNKGAERKGIALYEMDGFLIEAWFIMWLKINPFELAISKPEVVGPERKDLVDR